MAPRSSQATCLFSGAVDKLVAKLTSQGRSSGPIKHSIDVVNPANEALRAYRKNNTKVEASLINLIIPLLDSEEGEMCSRLDAQLFSIVIQTFLQAAYSRQVERGMHLLAAALYYDTLSKGRTVKKKKETIGKECLLFLLEFFINKENHDGMRRWVGLACLQLLGCEGNMDKIELMADDTRRSLGARLLEESNEILRSIFGRIIRTILDNENLKIEDLWPVDADAALYANFPESIMLWNSCFQAYTDEVVEDSVTNDQRYWAPAVTLKPSLQFGTKGHPTAVSLEQNKLVLWAASSQNEERFDQSIEIPYKFFKEATVRSLTDSQGRRDLTVLTNITLELENDKDNFCHMDCVGTVIHQVVLVMRRIELCQMLDNLEASCPGLGVDDETGDYRKFFNGELEEEVSQASPKKTHSQSDVHTFGNTASQNLASYAARTREIPETQLQDLIPARDGGKSETEGADDLDDEEDLVDEPAQPVKQLIPPSKSQKGKAAVKPKAKPPLLNLPKSGTKQILPEPQATKAKSKSTEEARPSQSDGEKLEATVAKLGAKFPSIDTPERRAVLVAANGNFTKATARIEEAILRKRIEHDETDSDKEPQTQKDAHKVRSGKATQTNSSSNAKSKYPFDSDAITTPETNDASTPNFISRGKENSVKPVPSQMKAGEKKAAKYSLKGNPSHSLPQPADPVVKNKGKSKAKDSGVKHPLAAPKPISDPVKDKDKSKAKKPLDEFDIPRDDDAQDDDELPVKKTGKGTTKSTTTTTKTNAGNKASKQPKADPKKRKSAPAALQNPVVDMRSKRAAAATASQKMLGADASDNGEEAEEVVAPTPKREPKYKKPAQALPKSLPKDPKVPAKRSTPDSPLDPIEDEDAFEQEQEDARSLGLTYDVADSEPDDLYGASPQRTVAVQPPHHKKGNQTITTKRATKSLGDLVPNKNKGVLGMASKLEDLLHDLDEPADDEDVMPPPRSVVQSHAKKFVFTGTQRSIVEETTIVKTSEERVARQAKETLATIEFSPLARQAHRARIGTKRYAPSPELTASNTKPNSKTKRATRQSQGRRSALSQPDPTLNAKAAEVSTAQNPIVIEDDESSDSETASEEGNAVEDMFVDAPMQDDPEEPLTTKKPNSTNKRKANADQETPHKKRKSADGSNSHDIQTPLRRSPRIRETTKADEAKSTKIQRKGKAKSPNPPTRSSPGQAVREANISGIPSAERTLIDDHLVRKTTVISFSARGPRNQGLTSVGKPAKALRKGTPNKIPAITAHKQSESKRKRTTADAEAEDDLHQIDSPPTKRQSVSPRENVQPTDGNDQHKMLKDMSEVADDLPEDHQDGSVYDNSGLDQDDISYQGPGSPQNGNVDVEDAKIGADDVEQILHNSSLAIQSPVAEVEPVEDELARIEKAITSNPPESIQVPEVQRAVVEEATAQRAIPSSPPAVSYQVLEQVEAVEVIEVEAAVAVPSSPPAPTTLVPEVLRQEPIAKKGSEQLSGRHSKQNSQISRVDENGSPIASSQVDHIGKAKRKLLEDPPPHQRYSVQGRDVDSEASPVILGPRVILASIPKARPSSPAKVEARYIPHSRTVSGLYEGIATKDVVEPEKKLADPFMGRLDRQATGFTELLLASASKTKNRRALLQVKGKTTPQRMIQRQAILPHHPAKPSLRPALKANGNSRINKQNSRVVVEDAEKTLVDSENDPPNDDNPSDMTSGTSNDSYDDDESRTSQQMQASNDMWNIALGPHYAKLSDAVRRIGEEVIIRLSNEEDTLGLLVDQYEENGNKLLTSLTHGRDERKASLEQQLGGKREQLVQIYEYARTFVDNAGDSGKKFPMVASDKQWRKDQEEVQKKIDEARRKLEG